MKLNKGIFYGFRNSFSLIKPLKTIDQKSDDFDRFWETYPKKTAKIEAQKAWKKAKNDKS